MTANEHTPKHGIHKITPDTSVGSIGCEDDAFISHPILAENLSVWAYDQLKYAHKMYNSYDALVEALKRMICSADRNCNIDKTYYGAQKALKDTGE